MANVSLTPSVAEALVHGYSLNDQDLLATLFGEKVAELVLDHFGSFQKLAQAGLSELQELSGVGKKRAVQLKALVEFSRRLFHKPMERGAKFTSSREVYNAYGPMMKGRQQESFWIILLDARNRVIKHLQISEGTLISCTVDPKDVFRAALKEGAVSMILLHNHPSGNPEPSQEDKELTQRISRGGELFNINVLDHLVISDDDYVSFADHGLM